MLQSLKRAMKIMILLMSQLIIGSSTRLINVRCHIQIKMLSLQAKLRSQLSKQEYKTRSQQLLRRAIKDIDVAMKLLDAEEVIALSRLRSALKDVKIAEGKLR